MSSLTEFREDHIPLAYFITFRAFGTWLHGREGSVDRFHHVYGTPKLRLNTPRYKYNSRRLAQSPVHLGRLRRRTINAAIKETCEIRGWNLWAVNIRSNHVHTVVTAPCDPERVLIALKANATRQMKEAGYWRSERSPWSQRGSKRRVWTEAQLRAVIAYVLYEQGLPLPE